MQLLNPAKGSNIVLFSVWSNASSSKRIDLQRVNRKTGGVARIKGNDDDVAGDGICNVTL